MPETPTKAGFYWYTPRVGAEVLVEILPGLLVREVGTTALIPVEALGGEFGERIPFSATLAAMRELAAKSPWEDFGFCHFFVVPEGLEHDATCPYPKAQEKRDE